MFKQKIGSKRQVWNRTAHHTAGGLQRHHLMKNKRGRIVSIRKHNLAKKRYATSGFKKYQKNKMEMAQLRKKKKK